MAETASLATLDQRRAQHAWSSIVRWSEPQPDGTRRYTKQAKEYAGEAKKLPVRIVASGLGQALAFVLAKAAKQEHLARLHEDLSDWVLRKRLALPDDPPRLMDSVLQGDAVFLRRATDEVIAYLGWLNRFAEAEGMTQGE